MRFYPTSELRLTIPQSNGKIERWHKSLTGECIRPGTPLSVDDARRLVEGYVDHQLYSDDPLLCRYQVARDSAPTRSSRP